MTRNIDRIVGGCLIAMLLTGCGSESQVAAPEKSPATAPSTTAKGELPAPAIDLPASTDGKPQTAVLAAGCFWCSEAVFKQLAGVTSVTSGYAGDIFQNATYELVSSHATNHAESVRVIYDPTKITYGQLLRVFFTVFDPTIKDRQGPDSGHQYRTTIFYENDDQKRVAEAYIKQLTDAKVFAKPIVTTVEPLDKGFFPAEDYHQNYVAEHPNDPYIRQNAVPKEAKVREHFKQLVKPE